MTLNPKNFPAYSSNKYRCPDCEVNAGGFHITGCSFGNGFVIGEPEPTATEGRKDDTGKDPWGLIPFDAIRAITKVLQFGAAKYSPRNWERGMDWNRPFDALMRHMTAWWEGEAKDPETGYSHLWHAGCCILFLIAFELRNTGNDNRPKINS